MQARPLGGGGSAPAAPGDGGGGGAHPGALPFDSLLPSAFLGGEAEGDAAAPSPPAFEWEAALLDGLDHRRTTKFAITQPYGQ